MTRHLGIERLLLLLFIASGFAGLIYQSIWSHYLGLSLGHAAYAQTLVLAIFMGGMALGSWLVSYYGMRWQRLIWLYAVIELLIGIAGLAFHSVFLGYTTLSQAVVYPSLEAAPLITAWQWGTAALLIAPQTVLLGMTFPLMSSGYLRIAPKADGEILGGLYFSNSLGAALGALVATFVLLPMIGMPGAMMAGGVLNLLVAAGAWLIAKKADALGNAQNEQSNTHATKIAQADNQTGNLFLQAVLIAAAVSGATSFVYEIGWIRMLNQSLGTTVHSFELMLAAFILGLAFGGWWVRQRSQKIQDALRHAGYAQLWKGVAALISIPVFAQSFYWVGALMEATPKTDSGYAIFSLGSAGIALLVMFPAAFFAGMTLPLFTMALLRNRHGESSIGRVYAANTLGAIMGVFAATHLLIPLLGLRLAVTLAALIDIGLGFYLLRRMSTQVAVRPLGAALACSLVVFVTSLHFGKPDPHALASGVFRHGMSQLDDELQINYLRDGKTATVAFYSSGTFGTIATNGKPDASIETDPAKPASEDELTMIMISTIPLAAHSKPEEIAIIGWGSGLSTHTILGSNTPKVVDTIEIERAMVDGARWYGKSVQRAYFDPRSKLHIDDARTFFSTGKRSYDVIISEPSNPWVSGVAALFTQEFYGFLRSHLKPDGLLLQWLQSYEINDELMFTMVAALLEEFPHVDAYLTNTADVLLLSSMEPIAPLELARLDSNPLRSELARVGLLSIGDYKVRKVASRSTLEALVALHGAKPHSDFYPDVSLNAPRTRFKGESVHSFMSLMKLGMPVLEITGARIPASLADQVSPNTAIDSVNDHLNAAFVRSALLDEPPFTLNEQQQHLKELVHLLRNASAQPLTAEQLSDWQHWLAQAADFSIGYLPEQDHQGIWLDPQWIDLEQQPESVQQIMAAYAAAARRDGAAMQEISLQVLDSLTNDAPLLLREHMLINAILGALQQGDFAGALSIEQEFGRTVGVDKYGFARSYLMAWGDMQAQMQGNHRD